MAHIVSRPSPASQSLVDVAYEHLLEGIVAHRYRGGDLVQEARIAADLGLSRTPVREALGRLEGESLLVRRGRALMVREVGIRDYLEVMHLRGLVEIEAVSLACGALAPALLADLRTRVVAMHDLSAVTAADHWAVDDAIHQSIAEASGSALLADLITDLRRKTRMFNLKRVPERFEPGRQEHLAILDALIAGQAGLAREAMRSHIDNTRQAILKVLGRF